MSRLIVPLHILANTPNHPFCILFLPQSTLSTSKSPFHTPFFGHLIAPPAHLPIPLLQLLFDLTNLNRPQCNCALVGPKQRKRKDRRALGKAKQKEGRGPSSCPPEGAPPRGRRGPKAKTPSAFLGTLCATHKRNRRRATVYHFFWQATNTRIVYSQERKS